LKKGYSRSGITWEKKREFWDEQGKVKRLRIFNLRKAAFILDKKLAALGFLMDTKVEGGKKNSTKGRKRCSVSVGGDLKGRQDVLQTSRVGRTSMNKKNKRQNSNTFNDF